MRTIPHRLVLVFSASLLLMISGCNGLSSVETPSRQMTITQARAMFVGALGKGVRDVVFHRHSISWKGSGSFSARIVLADVKDLSLFRNGDTKRVVYKEGKVWYGFETDQAAQDFVDALLVLKNAPVPPDTEETDFAEFSVSAKAWSAMDSKPPMPDEARAFKVLAVDALERKDFAAALGAYGKALEKFPMWPEGHYNAATLAADKGDYEMAAHHMRRYLALAPNAKDAAAAKDKFLLWQLKAKE